MRRIVYVSGTRADFGLMESTLHKVADTTGLEVSVCVTGMHLSHMYGNTVRDVKSSGLRICARIQVPVEAATGGEMAQAIGKALIGMVEVFSRERPDIVLVLGDRGEMLAGTLAAAHLGIPVVHVHGGERSGTIDEPVRHAISKLAHFHFVSTVGARRRLIRMGERASQIYVTGAPGLDGLREMVSQDRAALCARHGFDPIRPIALVIFHPVLQEAGQSGQQVKELLSAITSSRLQALVLMPNADAGSSHIRQALATAASMPDIRQVTHLRRAEFADWMAAADVMVGNSSSGIIEAASFGLPVVNIGSRQSGRERGRNVIDVDIRQTAIKRAIRLALARRRRPGRNIYGDGRAGGRIAALLKRIPLNPDLLKKSNAY